MEDKNYEKENSWNNTILHFILCKKIDYIHL